MADTFAAVKDFLRPIAHGFRYFVVREAFKVEKLFESEIQRNPVKPSRMFAFVTNICNARCTFCQYPKHEGPKGVLELDTFKVAVDQFSELGVEHLNLTPNNGDPLVDKGLIEKIKYAREKGMKHVGFNTNGILLSRGDIVEKIVEHVSDISISFPGLDPENYKRVYGVDKALELEEGLISLAETKIRMKSDINILLDFRIDRPFEEVLLDKGMQRLKPYIDDGIMEIHDIRSEMFNWSGVVSEDDFTGIMKMREVVLPKNLLPCNRTMSALNTALLPNGNVRACFCGRGASNEGRLIIGNVKDQHVEDIIHGDGHRKLLKDWMEIGAPDECKDCFVYQPNPMSWARVASLFLGVLSSPSWWKGRMTNSAPAACRGSLATEESSTQRV